MSDSEQTEAGAVGPAAVPGACAPEPERRRAAPFHPLLAAAFPVLALYARNMAELNLGQVVRPLGASVLAALVIWCLVAAATRHWRKGALCASASVLIFFSYGHLVVLTPPLLRSLDLPICAIALVSAVAVVLRSRGALHQVTAIVNATSLVLIAPSCWAIGRNQFLGRPSEGAGETRLGWHGHDTSLAVADGPGSQAGQGVPHTRTPVPPPVRGDLPDIYYIILDAYARSDSLQTFFSFDNGPFVQALRDRGFYVASKSRSNYDETPLSIASSLNMKYLDESVSAAAEYPNDSEPLRKMIDENAVAAALRPLGYRYVFIWTGAGQTRTETADLKLDSGARVSAFEGQVIGMSALAAAPVTRDSQYEQHRNYLLAGFHHLETVAALPYPKFVFAHILAPHPPFVFGRDGRPVNGDRPFSLDDGSWLLRDITRDQYREGYVGQIQYVNQRALAAIDAILRLSKRPPIVIVQGDHGSRMNLDWESQARTDLREPFSILNAYFVPDKVRHSLYATISPVNTFRLILSREFGQSLPRLPDRSFYSTASRPYDFSEVTHLIPEMSASTHPVLSRR